MPAPLSRRDFLADVGKGVLVASLGSILASDMGFAARADDAVSDTLSFGALDPLVALMQETPIDRLLPALVEKLKSGTDLRTLLHAAALANARTFGGEDYVGFHTMMALAPAFHMSQELPDAQKPLPVFKVLYRNTKRIAEHGGRKSEVLHPLNTAIPLMTGSHGEKLREAVRRQDVVASEQLFEALLKNSFDGGFNDLLSAVQDTPEVHRVVLPYRAWDLMSLIGREQAHTLLRQSVRYCVKNESWHNDANELGTSRRLLPQLMDQHGLMDKTPGTREADDGFIDRLSQTIFKSKASEAAEAAAAALAEGIRPADVGQAICLAANQLVLRDAGRTFQMEVPGKPIGSVHGDSIGVHACDSANAWRNLAAVSNPRNTFACLILGAFQVAHDRVDRGGDFLHWEPLPLKMHVDGVKSKDPAALLAEMKSAVEGNLQARAAAIVEKYGQLGHDPRPVFDLMLKYATTEDGALHAEKYYRTCSEEFANTRPAFRWRQLCALARVTASEYGRPAAGVAEAKELLKV